MKCFGSRSGTSFCDRSVGPGLAAAVARTHRCVIVAEGWKTGSLAAEITASLVETVFYDLDAPIARVCSAEVPIPYAAHLEQAALPQPETIAAAARAVVQPP